MSTTNGTGPLTDFERMRAYRYRPGIRTERCACGGFITGSMDAPKTLALTLWGHYAAVQHRAWRRRHAD